MNIAKTLRTALKRVAPKTREPLEIFYDKHKSVGGGHRYKMWATGALTPKQMFLLKAELEATGFPERIEYIDNVQGAPQYHGSCVISYHREPDSVAIYTRTAS